jgi:hypothetical protein
MQSKSACEITPRTTRSAGKFRETRHTGDLCGELDQLADTRKRSLSSC